MSMHEMLKKTRYNCAIDALRVNLPKGNVRKPMGFGTIGYGSFKNTFKAKEFGPTHFYRL